MMVVKQDIPVMMWSNESQNPENMHQMIFMSVVPVMTFSPRTSAGTSSLPKGKKAKLAMRKQAMPKGIPMIVTLHRHPARSQTNPSSQPPPKINHKMLPSKAIISILSLNFAINTPETFRNGNASQ